MSLSLAHEARARYEDLLREAAEARRTRQTSVAQPGALTQLRERIGDRLIALGNLLKAPARRPAHQD